MVKTGMPSTGCRSSLEGVGVVPNVWVPSIGRRRRRRHLGVGSAVSKPAPSSRGPGGCL
jgi:hypothetical protein